MSHHTGKNAPTRPGPELDFAAMPHRSSGPESRYSFRVATLEVQKVIERAGRGAQKAVALSIGLTESQMSAKLRGKTDEMTLEQLGKVATLLHAPAGWPWVAWTEEGLIESLPKIRKILGIRRTVED